MKKRLSIIACFCMILSATTMAQTKWLMAGSLNPNINLVDCKTGKIEWQHYVGMYQEGIECNCVQLTHEGNVLFAYKKGVCLITPEHKEIWNYHAPKGEEIHNAKQLPNGGYLLAVNSQPAKLVELAPDGSERRTVTIQKEIVDVNTHMLFRQIEVARNGNYLLPLLGKPFMMEVSQTGVVIREYNLQAGAFGVIENKNGQLMVALGDGHAIQTIDRKTGETIDWIGPKDLFNNELLFVAQLQKLKNGHYAVANWSGHGGHSPQIIEFDKHHQVVKTFQNEMWGPISTFYPIYKKNVFGL